MAASPLRLGGLVTRLTWSDELGKRVRTGDWDDQVVPTVVKIREAIEVGRGEDAAQLVDYFMEEAKVIHAIYLVWYPGFVEWLREAGVDDEELDAEIQRLKRLLAHPDGRPFEPEDRWLDLGREAGGLANLLRAGAIETGEALASLEALREAWRQVHDRWVDLVSGVLNLAARRFGEEALEDLYRHTLEPYIQERYMVYDLRVHEYEDTVFRNLYTTIEAMRGHLGGPDRLGDMEIDEYDDRWVVAFDPCGSGGRSSRGDLVEGTGPRPEAPYEFGVTQDEHDWSWNETGICYYCAHCCFALELLPAERWGHPVRVVDSPRYPDETRGAEPAKCTWTIYKSIEAIPEEAYVRIGRTKPSPT